MTYFAMALAWLFVALALMVAGVGYPAADLVSPDTLVQVHAVYLGWLSHAMCGALFQFVPVLVAKPLFSEECALPALVLLSAGLLLLLAGFLSLGGRLPQALWLFPAGAVLLVAGFGLVVVDLGLTAWLRRTGPARFVLVGLASLCATIAFGAVFAFGRAGWAGSPNAARKANAPTCAVKVSVKASATPTTAVPARPTKDNVAMRMFSSSHRLFRLRKMPAMSRP
ncbi:hypothetical protein [Bradyrhizobium sp.]|uniref:hypothetical protein n=1 Tax=Bradyrhizobium sp. TaxID=376 RepID=UPI0027351B72|nr:hypothetical protein [Bradyrhizobium sp.]MDP3691515.1 hypothetical protein [Bradyrhizobium sp.]